MPKNKPTKKATKEQKLALDPAAIREFFTLIETSIESFTVYMDNGEIMRGELIDNYMDPTTTAIRCESCDDVIVDDTCSIHDDIVNHIKTVHRDNLEDFVIL